jgi:hypothetical protein
LLQTVVAAFLVAACALYAAWTLSPVSARRRLALALLARPLPGFLARALAPHAARSTGCGCDGCDRNGAATPVARLPDQPVPLVFHPPRKR